MRTGEALMFSVVRGLSGRAPLRRVAAAAVLSIMASLLAVLTSSAAHAMPRPVSIMVVGDSISQGSSGDFTWRYRLYQHLVANNVAPTFVGTRTDLFDNVANAFDDDHTYADPNFDQHHDAIWGRKLQDTVGTIGAEVSAANPDYLLVLLGINDLTFGVTDAAGTESNLRSLIANVRSAKPNEHIVLGKLLPNQHRQEDAAFNAIINDYNSRLPAVAAQLTTATSPIVVAESGQDIDPSTDLWDGIHPNAQGE